MTFSFTKILFVVILGMQCLWGGWQLKLPPQSVVEQEGVAYIRPMWSPKGQLIAFTQERHRGLWILNTENGQTQMLTDETGAGFGFSWSNNGEAIVTRITRYEEKKPINEVKIFDVATQQTWTASDKPGHFMGLPRWSSDDSKVYIMGTSNITIFESGVAGASAALSGQSPAPLVYLSGGKIVVDKYLVNEKAVLDPLKDRRYINLQVSPDGRQVAFEVIGGNMFVMNSDGSELVDLGIGHRPQWSPDGNHLVYMITADDGHLYTQADIYLIHRDGSGKTNLTQSVDILEMNPSWSADGRFIAFNTKPEGTIYISEIVRTEN